MSYTNMDHAGWVQRNIEAAKKQKPTKRELRLAREEYKGWLAAPEELTPFQGRAFDLLGIVGNGIYNAPIAWAAVVWAPAFMVVPWRHGLGTFDFVELTRFVFLCHDARIRGYISPHGPRFLEIALHERSHLGGNTRRHPSLAEAVAAHREEIGEQHRICYRPAPAAAVEVVA